MRIRIDGMMAGGSSYMIFDRANGRTITVVKPKRTYLEKLQPPTAPAPKQQP
jgi:hypothetical protein